MRKTRTGRWVPDRPAVPEPEPEPDSSFEAFQVHLYTHGPGDDCTFTRPPRRPPPWDALRAISLQSRRV
jgi:hypothetical protein